MYTGFINQFFDLAQRELFGAAHKTVAHTPTAAASAAATENALRTILNSVNEAIFIHDSNGRIVDINQKAAELFAIDFENAMRLSFVDDCSGEPNRRAEFAGYWREALDGVTPTFEWLCKQPFAARTFAAEIYLRKLELNHRTYVLVSVRDISHAKKVEEKLRELAVKDDLTGIFNRRYFMQQLEQECERASRYGSEFSVLIIDADKFKAVNDTYGHIAGDAVLRELAHLGEDTFRDIDVFGRLGGEEFGVILRETDIARALQVAERFRALVSQSVINAEGCALRVTISTGIASSNQGPLAPTDILRRADAALYRAKKNGRNRVESCAAGDVKAKGA